MAWRLAGAVAILWLFVTDGMACEQWPVEAGTKVREYQSSTGLTLREYDTDGDGVADYGTATQPGARMPLFYSVGRDNPHDTGSKPFYAFEVYIDRGGKGWCDDIELYLKRTVPPGTKVPV